MLSTYLRADAVKRLRHGIPWVFREEIVSMDGTPAAGEAVELRDEAGHLLGVGDVDLQSALAIRRLGLPDERAEGLIQRHLRAAVQRRALWVEDPRYARLVNEDGDGLPGLIVDRFDSHYVVQTLTRGMDARVEEITRSLGEVLGASSILLRNDSPVRARLKLPLTKSHVLAGSPPRWSRVLELGARLTFDLMLGSGTGYSYDEREVRRLLSRISNGARVLNVNCGIGGLFVHAGRHGAKQILAAEENAESLELARENAEANALISRTRLQLASPLDVLQGLKTKFDLVLLRMPELPRTGTEDLSAFIQMVRLAIRATSHGGKLVLAATSDTILPSQFEDQVALACELEGRLGYRLARPGLPGDFPLVLGSPNAVTLNTLAMEVS